MDASVVLAGGSAVLGLVGLAAWTVKVVRARQGAEGEFESETRWLGRIARAGGVGAAVCSGGLVLWTLGAWWGLTTPSTPLDGSPVTNVVADAKPTNIAPEAPKADPEPVKNTRPKDTVAVPALDEDEESPARKRARQLFEMAEAAETGRSYIEARKTYRRATVVDPSYGPAWLGLATMEALRMDEVGALTALQSYHSLNPDTDLMSALKEREDFEPLLGEDRFVGKVAVIQKGASLDTVLRGVQAERRSAPDATRFAPAERAEATRLQPVRNNNPRQLARELNKRGFQAYKEGRMEDARSLYYQATQVYAGHAIAWYNLACMEALRGDQDGAVSALKRFAALSPRVSVVAKVNKDRDFDPIRRSSWFQEQLQLLSRRP